MCILTPREFCDGSRDVIMTRGCRSRNGRRSGVQIEAVRQLAQFGTMIVKSSQLAPKAELCGQDYCNPGSEMRMTEGKSWGKVLVFLFIELFLFLLFLFGAWGRLLRSMRLLAPLFLFVGAWTPLVFVARQGSCSVDGFQISRGSV